MCEACVCFRGVNAIVNFHLEVDQKWNWLLASNLSPGRRQIFASSRGQLRPSVTSRLLPGQAAASVVAVVYDRCFGR